MNANLELEDRTATEPSWLTEVVLTLPEEETVPAFPTPVASTPTAEKSRQGGNYLPFWDDGPTKFPPVVRPGADTGGYSI